MTAQAVVAVRLLFWALDPYAVDEALAVAGGPGTYTADNPGDVYTINAGENRRLLRNGLTLAAPAWFHVLGFPRAPRSNILTVSVATGTLADVALTVRLAAQLEAVARRRTHLTLLREKAEVRPGVE